MRTERFAGVGSRIALINAAACALILAFTAGVIKLQAMAFDEGTRAETLSFAQSVAYVAGKGNTDLQAYVMDLYRLFDRDVVIVDRNKKGIADVDPRTLGDVFSDDRDLTLQRTLEDGRSRAFIERNADHPDGLGQYVVPFRRAGRADGEVLGAVIVESEKIRQQMLAPMRWQFVLVAVAGLLCAAIVAFLGIRLARSVARSEATIESLAYHDELTGIYNRTMFSRLFEQSLLESRRYGRRLAIFFIDLDRFKIINDTLGHEAGDLLLRKMAMRIKRCLRSSDVVARLGGDEFIVLLPDVSDLQSVAAVAQNVLSTIARSTIIAGQQFSVTGSIGISVFPGDGADERTMMKHADIAMYQAKEDGKNCFVFYSEQMDNHSMARLTFESSLRQALDDDQFEVYYQPKVDCRTGRITGLEALLRWIHPELGMVSPVKFIPVAEETGLIVPLGRWVLQTVCEQHVAWRARGLGTLPIAVNLSARQFYDENLLAEVRDILLDTGMDAHFLEFEITESMLVRDVDQATAMLKALKAMGIRLSVDDFGTGYSSLSNLKRFPIDTIKIDRSFVRELPSSAEDIGIADAIITMGKTLGMSIVAEGVETLDQAEFLRDHFCDEYQGFYFSRPIPAHEIVTLVERKRNDEVHCLATQIA